MLTPKRNLEAAVEQIVEGLKLEPGALLPILHAVQKGFGYIPEQSIPIIAAALKQTPAEIHGVISFYHQFRTTPPGRHRVQVCRAEACQARGGRHLEQHAKDTLGVDYHQTCADGSVTLDSVYCLGNCATGPNIRVDDRLYGRVDDAKFDAVIEQLKTGVTS